MSLQEYRTQFFRLYNIINGKLVNGTYKGPPSQLIQETERLKGYYDQLNAAGVADAAVPGQVLTVQQLFQAIYPTLTTIANARLRCGMADDVGPVVVDKIVGYAQVIIELMKGFLNGDIKTALVYGPASSGKTILASSLKYYMNLSLQVGRSGSGGADEKKVATDSNKILQSDRLITELDQPPGALVQLDGASLFTIKNLTAESLTNTIRCAQQDASRISAKAVSLISATVDPLLGKSFYSQLLPIIREVNDGKSYPNVRILLETREIWELPASFLDEMQYQVFVNMMNDLSRRGYISRSFQKILGFAINETDLRTLVGVTGMNDKGQELLLSVLDPKKVDAFVQAYDLLSRTGAFPFPMNTMQMIAFLKTLKNAIWKRTVKTAIDKKECVLSDTKEQCDSDLATVLQQLGLKLDDSERTALETRRDLLTTQCKSCTDVLAKSLSAFTAEDLKEAIASFKTTSQPEEFVKYVQYALGNDPIGFKGLNPKPTFRPKTNSLGVVSKVQNV